MQSSSLVEVEVEAEVGVGVWGLGLGLRLGLTYGQDFYFCGWVGGETET